MNREDYRKAKKAYDRAWREWQESVEAANLDPTEANVRKMNKAHRAKVLADRILRKVREGLPTPQHKEGG